jgi:3-keto-disaccharide hydrolase
MRVTVTSLRSPVSSLAILLTALAVLHGQTPKPIGYSDTPMLPGGKWHVHDGTRPQPTVVNPGTFSTQATPGAPPSDAIVLFDGTDLSKWQNEKGGPAPWKIESGAMVVAAGTGGIQTKDAFGDCQLHVEWATPAPPRGEDQDRGNSGVFLMSRYEIQVLDSYNSKTYPDGQAGAIYGQFPPLVNASRKPGDWQAYDIVFTAPRFNGQSVNTPATVTVFHNGVVVHNHATLIGGTVHRALAKYEAHPDKAPLMLQDHEHPVRYRNIWIRNLKSYDQP